MSRLANRHALAAPFVLLIAAALYPSSGQSQHRSVNGTYRYAGSAEEGAAIVRDAVEPVLARMRPDLQPIARERIAESTWLPETIRISTGRSHIRVVLRGTEQRTFSTSGGGVMQVPMRHGYAQLTQSVRADGSLQQDFTALDGTQQNVFTAGPGHTMTLRVALQSPQLPSDIQFTLSYR